MDDDKAGVNLTTIKEVVFLDNNQLDQVNNFLKTGVWVLLTVSAGPDIGSGPTHIYSLGRTE